MADTTSSALDLNAWKASLTRWADGLDLGTEHGWDVFLRRVQDNTMATRLTLLQEVSRALTGENDVPTTRGGTIRRITYAWVLHGVGPVLRPTDPEIATFTTVDDDTCGVRITWDGSAYVATGIETGHQVARTASACAVIAHVGAYLISYEADADGDWSATAAQGRDLLAELDRQAEFLDEARANTIENGR